MPHKRRPTIHLLQWSKYTEFFGCAGVDEFPIVEATSLVQFNMVSFAAVGPFAGLTSMFTNYQAKRTEFLKVASELDGNGTQPQTIGDGMALIKASLAWYLSQVAFHSACKEQFRVLVLSGHHKWVAY